MDNFDNGVLYEGDCIEVCNTLPSCSIDLTVTSPPYDDMRTYGGNIDFDFKPLAHQLHRLTAEGGIVVWVIGDQTKNFCESLSSFKQAIYFVEETGFNLLDTMIYEKANGPSPYPNMKRYAPWSEYMFVFSKGRPKTFNPIKDKENVIKKGKTTGSSTQRDGSLKKTGNFDRRSYTIRHNVWRYNVGLHNDTKDRVAAKHPARFPEKLAEDHIKSWSNEGDTVLDPLAGSGTTLKAAALLNRKYIGIEVDDNYCSLIRERLSLYDLQGIEVS